MKANANIHSPQLQQQTTTPEAVQESRQVFGGKDVDEYLKTQREHQRCAFCSHPSLIEANNTGITLCMHCFRIMQAKIDGLKRFLDCE